MNLPAAMIGALAAISALASLRHGPHVNTIGGIIQISIVAAVGIFGAAILMVEVLRTLN